jgi:TolA-binding protein
MLASVPFIGGFLGKIGLKGVLTGLALVGVVATVAFGYWHYTSLLDKVSVLERNDQVQKQTIETQHQTIDAQGEAIQEWEEAQEELQRRLERLQRVARQARQETRRLNDIFAEHDLGRLAREKPGLIERRVNDGTADALRMLECASGADLPQCGDRGQPTAEGDSAPEAGTD